MIEADKQIQAKHDEAAHELAKKRGEEAVKDWENLLFDTKVTETELLATPKAGMEIEKEAEDQMSLLSLSGPGKRVLRHDTWTQPSKPDAEPSLLD